MHGCHLMQCQYMHICWTPLFHVLLCKDQHANQTSHNLIYHEEQELFFITKHNLLPHPEHLEFIHCNCYLKEHISALIEYQFSQWYINLIGWHRCELYALHFLCLQIVLWMILNVLGYMVLYCTVYSVLNAQLLVVLYCIVVVYTVFPTLGDCIATHKICFSLTPTWDRVCFGWWGLIVVNVRQLKRVKRTN